MNKIVAVVGMCGAGKSEVTNMFINEGYARVYFGDATFDEIKRLGLEINWENEKMVREKFRATGDMAIYAKKCENKIAELYNKGNIVVESLYSWSEYTYLKEIYGDAFSLVCVVTDRAVREKRLATRPIRPMTADDVKKRDYSEIENIEKGGPIGRADYYIMNNGTFEELKNQTYNILEKLK